MTKDIAKNDRRDAYAALRVRDFRLFLWETHDTAHAFAQLAQRGDIRFERSGKTVILDVGEHPKRGQQ